MADLAFVALTVVFFAVIALIARRSASRGGPTNIVSAQSAGSSALHNDRHAGGPASGGSHRKRETGDER